MYLNLVYYSLDTFNTGHLRGLYEFNGIKNYITVLEMFLRQDTSFVFFYTYPLEYLLKYGSFICVVHALNSVT
jgi:hypothetical protein